MTSDRTKFKGLDEAFKSQVQLGDNKKIRIEGQGTTGISIGNKKKFIQDVCYAPCLAHNLLSVDQLMETGLLLRSKDMVSGLPMIKSLEKTQEGCMVGKQAKQSFLTGKSKRVLELIHADLCGSMRTESLAGSKYFMLLTNDFDRMSWAYFLKYKSESFDCFKKFKALVENQSGKSIKVLQTDHRGEFLSKEFYDFCDGHGILRKLTSPYTFEQNGVAERKNRTVVEMTQCIDS
ncbi:retrovirus-related pol polyprotein from transposon TNT 1-94 [Tanacetum coccineum]